MPYDALREGRHSQPHQIYHITTVTKGREPVFTDFARGRIAVRQLMQLDQEKATETLCFVVMPDHVHWLLGLQKASLSDAVMLFKGRTARQIGRPLWQPNFHDHALRSEEDVAAIARYIVANPLRAGIVERIGDYPLWDAIWM
jgi:REP element-mobilizing transposase RayT